MYNPEAVNDVANWIVLVSVFPFAFLTAVYGVLTPWYKSLLGVTFFGLLASITSVLAFIWTRRLWGDYMGYELIAVTVYSLLTIFVLAFIAIFFVERNRAGLLVFSTRRTDKEN